MTVCDMCGGETTHASNGTVTIKTIIINKEDNTVINGLGVTVWDICPMCRKKLFEYIKEQRADMRGEADD